MGGWVLIWMVTSAHPMALSAPFQTEAACKFAAHKISADYFTGSAVTPDQWSQYVISECLPAGDGK
jgi:hypothetical protein